MVLICELCDKHFKSYSAHKYHINKLVCSKYTCTNCKKNFASKKIYNTHKIDCIEVTKNSLYCDICNINFSTKFSLQRHLKKSCINTLKKNNNSNIVINNNTINNTINITNITNNIVLNIGHENIKFLTPDRIFNIIFSYTPESVISKVFELKHLNNKYPENHNIYMENIKEKRIIAQLNNEEKICTQDDIFMHSICSTNNFINTTIDHDERNKKIKVKSYNTYSNNLTNDIIEYQQGNNNDINNKYIRQKERLEKILLTHLRKKIKK